ncbi:MAG: hypothetical protein FMNOHCHN_03275 [Ignavibacteriaceae bacterium]|nr:hypothetical protein [Ignavibacteriaceae bacterium]
MNNEQFTMYDVHVKGFVLEFNWFLRRERPRLVPDFI